MAPNLLNRQFMVAAPSRAWVADITAIWTLEGWLYLAAVLDLHDRQLEGWAMADHRLTRLALDAQGQCRHGALLRLTKSE